MLHPIASPVSSQNENVEVKLAHTKSYMITTKGPGFQILTEKTQRLGSGLGCRVYRFPVSRL